MSFLVLSRCDLSRKHYRRGVKRMVVGSFPRCSGRLHRGVRAKKYYDLPVWDKWRAKCRMLKKFVQQGRSI